MYLSFFFGCFDEREDMDWNSLGGRLSFVGFFEGVFGVFMFLVRSVVFVGEVGCSWSLFCLI